jgi:hypothetical protein
VKFSASVNGSISAALDQINSTHKRSQLRGLTQGSVDLKSVMRGDIEQILGARMAGTWRSKIYTNNGRNPAALVYSKAPHIISAYAKGATIVATAGRRLLALPSDAVPKGSKGHALDPRGVEARYGKKLRFVPAKDAHGAVGGSGKAVAYLVLDGIILAGAKGRARNANARQLAGSRRANARPVQSVVMFDLVTSVHIAKALDLDARAKEAAANTSLLIAGGMS